MKPKQSKEYDHIDAELSKIYFNKHTAKSSPLPQKKKPDLTIKFFILTFLVFSALALTFFFILSVTNHSKKPLSAKTKTVVGTKANKSIAPAPSSKNKETKGETSAGYKILYNFETDTEGWEIPLWAAEKPDHAGKILKQVRGTSSKGSSSLILTADFPGNTWSAALVEITHYLDLNAYDSISVDIYVPPACPKGLKAQIILTIGDNWRFVEMSRTFPLTPGEWTTITGDLTDKSPDWRRTTVDENFRKDIRKIAIRIESNGKPVYSGPIYIDNIRVTGKSR